MAAPNDIEALVGHLFVVGGRMISSASPGAMAVPPPRRAARGRDADTLFGLLSVVGPSQQPALFYEQINDRFSDKYFSVGGSVTSALREAFSAANDLAHDLQAGRSVSVGLACAILRQQELYLAITGPAYCFVLSQAGIERLPEIDEPADAPAPLGSQAQPDVRFYHREIEPGDFLILSDSTFGRLTATTLRHAASTGEVNDTLNNLASVSSEFTAAEVIKFVEPLSEGEDDATSVPRRNTVPPIPFLAGKRGETPGSAVEPASEPGPLPPGTARSSAGGSAMARRAPRRSPFSPQRLFQQAGHNMARGMARATGSAQTVVERMLPEDASSSPLAKRFALSTTMQIGIAIGVALLVALLTTVVYRFRGQTSQYAQYVREAQSEIEQAREGQTQAAARPHWETAVFLLDQAALIREPGTEIRQLQEEAHTALDSYDQIQRVSPVLLRSYEAGAVLRGPVLHGLNMYLIDTTRDVLYREDLDDTGTRLTMREPQVITRQGELIDNQVVAGLVDLAWIEDGGTAQRNVLGVLTRNGLLITYSPSWDATAVPLPGSQAWVDPRAIAIYERDLYVLDAGASEIWRYAARGNAYPAAPDRYFTDVTPDLSDAIDMEIDSNGNVYVLHAGGRVSKYFFGREEGFSFEGMPQPLVRPTALFLNVNLYDRALFITDAEAGRITTVALNGAFLANYKDVEGRAFSGVSGVFNQDRPAWTYITASNQLYYFSRP